MRTSDKLAALIFLVTAFCYGQTTSAQGIAPMTYGQNGMPMGNHSPVSWGALPSQGFEPWPTVSPFENKFSQHLNQNGLWFSDSVGATAAGQRKYFFSIDALKTKTKEDRGLVGNSNSQSYYELVYDDLVTETSQQYADDFENYNYYSAVGASITGVIEGSGMRMTTGYWNADESGVILEGLWHADATATYDARSVTTTFSPFAPTSVGAFGSPGSQTGFVSSANQLAAVRSLLSAPDFFLTDIDPIDIDELLQRNLLNLNGIPIDDGTFGGASIPYDLNFRIEQRSQVLGGGISFVMSPVVKSSGFKLRPVVGLRYMNVDESFKFTGEDSGALYDATTAGTGLPTTDLKLQSIPDGLDNDSDGIVDNGTIAENETTFTSTFISLVAAQGGDGASSSIINSFLTSKTTSHLAGPEIGVRYDFGDGDFKVWGQTKVGLLANREELTMTGDNIGVGTRVDATFDGTTLGTPTELFAPTLDNPNPNAFTDSSDSTHVSPLIEQSLFAEIPVFSYLPVLQDMRTFEGARLKLGYTVTFIDHIASNSESIVWRGNPQAGLFPTYDPERRSWWTSSFSAGLEWRY